MRQPKRKDPDPIDALTTLADVVTDTVPDTPDERSSAQATELGDAEPGAADTASNERRCIVTRRSASRDGLIRFVVAPDQTLTPDLAESLPGRGIWVTASGDALSDRSLPRAAARAAKAAVKVDPALAGTIEKLLVARCQSLIGLARRSGAVQTGFEKVRTAILSGGSTLMLAARDSDGRDAKELGRRADALSGDVRRSKAMTSTELGAAMGRDLQVHLSVADGPLADRLYRDLNRLASVRGASEAEKSIEENAPSGEAGETARDAARGR